MITIENADFCCPYCNVINVVRLPMLPSYPFVVLCQVDQGGCDRYFVAQIKNVDLVTNTQKIGGEE